MDEHITIRGATIFHFSQIRKIENVKILAPERVERSARYNAERRRHRFVMAIRYVIEGRETAECWQDDGSMRVVHGPADRIGVVARVNQIPPLVREYLVGMRVEADSLERFITVTERDSETDEFLGQRIFAPADFGKVPQPPGVSPAVISIAEKLIANGRAKGVSK